MGEAKNFGLTTSLIPFSDTKISIMIKKCNKCLQEKSFNDFYKDSRLRDGVGSTCKECSKKSSMLIYEKTINNTVLKRRRLDMMYKNNKANRQRYEAKYPEKRKAKFALITLPKTNGLERHHWCYRDEFIYDFILLPKSNHIKAHNLIEYMQGSMIYKIKSTGEILDTKEKHYNFLKSHGFLQ